MTNEYDFDKGVTQNLTLYAAWSEKQGSTPPPTEYTEYPFIGGYPDGTFKPDNSITRAEAAQILYNILADGASGDVSKLDGFNDITSGHWAANALSWVVEQGYFKGYEDGTIKRLYSQSKI